MAPAGRPVGVSRCAEPSCATVIVVSIVDITNLQRAQQLCHPAHSSLPRFAMRGNG